MKFTLTEIREFQELYLREYGEQISESEAEIQAKSILNFLSIILNRNKK